LFRGGGSVTFKFWFVLFVVIFFGWGMYADYGVEIARFFAGEEVEGITSAGAWGDTFGAFNGLVSLAGALFVLRTLALQQEAIAEQRTALEEQFADSHRQRFEATFFELLKLFRELRSELRYSFSKDYVENSQTDSTKEERAALRVGTNALLAFTLEQQFKLKKMMPEPSDASREQIIEAYEETMSHETERTFSPYFRMIYTIMARLRSDTILSKDEKENYARLFRSQMTNIELIAMAYNSISPRSADLEDLVVEYRMLKYMPESKLRTQFQAIFGDDPFMARA
jgi:hypothetical protein